MGRINVFSVAVLSVFFLFSTIHASDAESGGRKNALSIKFGYSMYAQAGIPMDYWIQDRKDFSDWGWEFSYERRIMGRFTIETAGGRFGDKSTYRNLVVSFDKAVPELHNNYLSLTAKYGFPLGGRHRLYIGAGADYYRTQTEFRYYEGGSVPTYSVNESFNSFGGHGLIGYEFLLYPDPARKGLYDMPVAVFCEFKYTQVTVGDADKHFIDDYNEATGASLSYKDKGVGTHMILAGLKWYV